MEYVSGHPGETVMVDRRCRRRGCRAAPRRLELVVPTVAVDLAAGTIRYHYERPQNQTNTPGAS